MGRSRACLIFCLTGHGRQNKTIMSARMVWGKICLLNLFIIPDMAGVWFDNTRIIPKIYETREFSRMFHGIFPISGFESIGNFPDDLILVMVVVAGYYS